MTTLPLLELPHLALGVAAIIALSGGSISADLGDADDQTTVDRFRAGARRRDARIDHGGDDVDAG